MLPDEIRMQLGNDEDVLNLVNADNGEEDWFSRSPCECCGSELAGDRNRLAVLAI